MAQAPSQEPAEGAAEVPAGSSKKKLMIIIIAAVLVLGIGGGAAWYFLSHKSEAKEAKEGEHGAEAAKEEEHAPPQAPVFLPLETFTVNLQPDPDEKFLQVDVTLQVKSPEVAERLKVQMPAVRNRMLMLLTSKQASEIANAEGKAQLSQDILTELQKPYVPEGKPEEVTGVLFTSFVIQ